MNVIRYFRYGPRLEILSSGFPTKCDSNKSPELHRLARIVKIRALQV